MKTESTGMERVDGIGGFFFRSADPMGLAEWYHRHLGIGPVPEDEMDSPWQTAAGPTVFAPFRAESDYFRADKAFMLNFRVADLAAMVAQLEAAGVAVKVLPDMPGVGRFAHLHDPEGTPIELWEPEVA